MGPYRSDACVEIEAEPRDVELPDSEDVLVPVVSPAAFRAPERENRLWVLLALVFLLSFSAFLSVATLLAD